MVDSINKNDILFAIGPAGTGKTYTAVALAVRALRNKEINVWPIGCRPQLMQLQSSDHEGIKGQVQLASLLQLDLRLGEGSGAALALPLLRLACALHNGMATFAEAAVAERSAAP